VIATTRGWASFDDLVCLRFSLGVREHLDVEKLGAGSGAEGIEAFADTGLETHQVSRLGGSV
jgi:hypothetical protein